MEELRGINVGSNKVRGIIVILVKEGEGGMWIRDWRKGWRRGRRGGCELGIGERVGEEGVGGRGMEEIVIYVSV